MQGSSLTPDELRNEAIEDLSLRAGDNEPTFNRVVQIAGTALGAPNVAFSVLYNGQQMYLATKGVPLTVLPAEQTLCAITTRQESPLLTADASHSDLADHPGVAPDDGIRFYAGMPVRAPGGETIGSFCIFDFTPRRLTITERRLLGDCAGLIEDALRLRTLASRDGLTGLLNRREFDMRLKAETRRAQLDGAQLSVALLDLDYFKHLNDRLGHDAGDVALRQIGQLIERKIRGDRDSACRYGGEEFGLILPGMPAERAQQRLNELRLAVRELGIANPTSPKGIMTISGGVCQLDPGEPTSSQQLALHADEALYHAKAQGRDQIVVWPLE